MAGLKKQLFKRGFTAVANENKRREKAREAKKGKLFRFYLKKGDVDVPIRFLTEDPISFWEHTIKEGSTFSNYPCAGEGCEHCASGDKPRYVSAWLVVDKRTGTYKDKEGNEKTFKDRIKVLVRGLKDSALLENLSRKYTLVDREYTVTRTGEGTSTTWMFDRGEVDKLSPKQLDALLAQLPEEMRDMDLYDIVINQVSPEEEDEEEDSSKVEAPDVESGVSSIEEEEEEEAPAMAKLLRKTIKEDIEGDIDVSSSVSTKVQDEEPLSVPSTRETLYEIRADKGVYSNLSDQQVLGFIDSVLGHASKITIIKIS